MLISGEFYDALRDGGTGDEKAMAAAALMADHELRLRRLDEIITWLSRLTAIIGTSIIAAAVIAIALRQP